MIAATGIWVHFGQVDDLVRKLDRHAWTPPPAQPVPPLGATPVSLDSIVRTAQSRLPGAEIMAVQFPPSAPVRVQLRFPEDRTPGGRSYLFLDRFRGTILLAQSTREAELGSYLVTLKRSLHTGDVLGPPTRVIWFLASIILALQAVTGLLMWWNARWARRATPARRDTAAL